MWIRLRQIALVAKDLDPVVADLRAVFGLGEGYNDPGVDTFGLRNAVVPVGAQFIEVVSPVRDNTAGGRYLERRGGDGGYMVILQCDDHAPVKARVDAQRVRKVVEHDGDHYRIMQLHPRDTGGTFLEIDVQVDGESMDGPWEPAGPTWQQQRTDTVHGITAAEIQCENPDVVAAKWSAAIGAPVQQAVLGAFTVPLDNATLRFVAVADGRGEGLGGIDVRVRDVATTTKQAAARGVGDGQTFLIGGLRIRVLS